MIYLKLFFSFLQVGLFSIGGGYAALPLIQEQIVTNNHWLTMSEFTDIITISQMTPGPIAINAATFVGTRVGGFLGSIIATLGCVFPSIIIVLILSMLYKKYKNLSVVNGVLSGLRPAVVGLIASAGATIIITALWGDNPISLSVDFFALAVIIISVVVLQTCKKISPIVIMLSAGVIGGIVYSFI